MTSLSAQVSNSLRSALSSSRSSRALPSPNGPLTREQKARLMILAREAFEKHCAETGERFTAAGLETWRRAEQVKACGKASLRASSQMDFLPLKAHFLNLLGDSGNALNLLLHQQTEPARQARFKLEEACEERGLAMSYPAAICKRQYRCSLDEANAKQLWHLVFTVRNRRKSAKTIKGNSAAVLIDEESFAVHAAAAANSEIETPLTPF
ncbi:MAG: hypothetical protein PHI35_00710 [Victivallaceae bacterium]|nr:hypothetical protein [Victivallaceae bacterium]